MHSSDIQCKTYQSRMFIKCNVWNMIDRYGKINNKSKYFTPCHAFKSSILTEVILRGW